MLFSSIINYTKKSLRPHGLGDFSVRGVFLQPLFLYSKKRIIRKFIRLVIVKHLSAELEKVKAEIESKKEEKEKYEKQLSQLKNQEKKLKKMASLEERKKLKHF